jgi:hypothetical protein
MKKGRGINETFTVRRIVNNEGVERIFPLHSPFISKVVVKRGGETRRAKLFYLRDRVGKAVKLTETKRAKAGDGASGDGQGGRRKRQGGEEVVPRRPARARRCQRVGERGSVALRTDCGGRRRLRRHCRAGGGR